MTAADMSGLNNSEDENNESSTTEMSQETPVQETAPVESDATPQEPEAETVDSVDPVAADEPLPAESSQPDPTEASTPEPQSPPPESSEPAAEQPEGADSGEGKSEPKPKEKRRRSKYERGEIIEVMVKEVSPTSVVVELDERGEGFAGLIPNRELDRMTPDMVEMLKPGEKVKLYVVNTGNLQGNVILSLNRALEALDWQEAEEYQKSRDIYEGVIAGYNKGGLIVRFGRLRGFIPQSQISDERRARVSGDSPDSRWSDMVKEPITVKVIEVDSDRNRLILSERAAARETREARKASLIEELTVNEVRQGRVVSLEDFGAFVDIGGAEGLIHLTELSWGHITHPKQVLEVGQEITVEVINVDPERKRIGLSLRRQLTDPWDEIAATYQQGQLVKAEVTKLTKFGAFAQLVDQPDVEGLVHISELSENRVGHPREVVQIGEVLTLRIVKIDVADRRLGLSLKRVNSTEYLDSDMDYLFD